MQKSTIFNAESISFNAKIIILNAKITAPSLAANDPIPIPPWRTDVGSSSVLFHCKIKNFQFKINVFRYKINIFHREINASHLQM